MDGTPAEIFHRLKNCAASTWMHRRQSRCFMNCAEGLNVPLDALEPEVAQRYRCADSIRHNTRTGG